jgi:hypothetical protein
MISVKDIPPNVGGLTISLAIPVRIVSTDYLL